MKFFRVENKEHRGPYNNGSGISIIDTHADHIERYLLTHPDPMGDSMLKDFWGCSKLPYKEMVKYRFGFNSLEQLIVWFDNPYDWHWLFIHKFQISVYEVDYMIIGETQSVCHQDRLKEIKQIISFDNSDKKSIYYI